MHNGMGSLDWSAFDLAVEHYGVADPASLIDRLLAIKGHKAPTGEQAPSAEEN